MQGTLAFLCLCSALLGWETGRVSLETNGEDLLCEEEAEPSTLTGPTAQWDLGQGWQYIRIWPQPNGEKGFKNQVNKFHRKEHNLIPEDR